ncbi:MAG: antibiotic biosynthesis monooxygenase [Bacteroidota bacterium]
MNQIFIDRFVVPKNSFEEFVQRMKYNRNFIKNMPGFIKDEAYKSSAENGNIIIVTVAVWENEELLLKAKEAVQAEYKRIGFNLPEMLTRLNITIERGTYKEIES